MRMFARPGLAWASAGLCALMFAAPSMADHHKSNERSASQQEMTVPASSPIVSLSADVPQELRVGQEFEFKVRVRNTSDNVMVHDLVLDQQSSEAFQIEKIRMADNKKRKKGKQQSKQGQKQDQKQSKKQSQKQAQKQSQKQSQKQGQKQGQSDWTIDKLEPGESKTIHVTAIASKEGDARACLAVKSYKPALCLRTSFVKPDLELVKEAPEQVNICEEIEVAYYIKNTGSGDADKITIRDPLAKGLQTIEGEKELKFDVNGLKENDVRKFVATLRASKDGEFSSRAVASLKNGNKTHSNKTTTDVRKADLAIQIDGPDVQYVKRPMSYTVTVANKGSAPATDAKLALHVPESASIVRVSDLQQAEAADLSNSSSSSNQQPTPAKKKKQSDSEKSDSKQKGNSKDKKQSSSKKQSDSKQKNSSKQKSSSKQQSDSKKQRQNVAKNQEEGSWELGTLEPGEGAKLNFTLKMDEAAMIKPEAVATFVCGTETGRKKADVKAVAMQRTELIALPDLMLSVVDNKGTVPKGENVTYTIVVKNQGEAADHDVRISARLPDGLKLVEAEGDSNVENKSDSEVTFASVDKLEPNDRIEYAVVAKASGDGEVLFETTLRSEGLNREATAEEPTQLFARTARANN